MTETERDMMDQAFILKTALAQSAEDCACRPDDFLKNINVVTESVPSQGARKYLKLPHILDLTSYGSNVVASCRADLKDDIGRIIDRAPGPSSCFETPMIYLINRTLEKADARVCFMAEYFLPDIDLIFGADLECSLETRLLFPVDFESLYLPQWKNALCEDRKQLDVLGVGAYDGGRLVGFAGCSADCDMMWQIGIDVLPEYRKRGIASALTNRLAREIIAREKVPFYCAAWSNVRSVKNALRSGFKPAWSQLTAKSNTFIEDMQREHMKDASPA